MLALKIIAAVVIVLLYFGFVFLVSLFAPGGEK
jgi:hypothetical protein